MMNLTKYLCPILLVITCSLIPKTICGQKEDIWSGQYILVSPEVETADTLIITPIATADRENITNKYDKDLPLWELSSTALERDDATTGRQFLLNEEENEYDQFGWKEMAQNGEITCLDAGHFFICQTNTNNEIRIEEESFFTETGIFGIRRHQGLFELKKLD